MTLPQRDGLGLYACWTANAAIVHQGRIIARADVLFHEAHHRVTAPAVHDHNESSKRGRSSVHNY